MNKIDEMLGEARFLRNGIGDAKGAIKECDKILKIEPENRDAMLIKAGRIKDAEHFRIITTQVEDYLI